MRVRRIALWSLVLFLVALCGAAGAGIWALKVFRAPGPLMDETTVLIPRGSGVNAIADRLAAAGVIAHPHAFRAAVFLKGAQSSLRAGEYLFPSRQPMAEVIDRLARGDVFIRKITIPEGLTSYQIVALLKAAPGLEGPSAGLALPAEGSLLPDTYQYMYGDTQTRILTRMKEAMDREKAALWVGRFPNLPFSTPEQAVTLASIVEKETGVASERGRIAGVFINRLRAGMKLQSDPTALYALTGGRPQDEGQGPIGRRLMRGDLDIDSPYNTYRYAGLPPGPIAHPGREALAAVLNPERHDFLYFVADGKGGHVFSRTLDEHNANVARWRRVRAGP